LQLTFLKSYLGLFWLIGLVVWFFVYIALLRPPLAAPLLDTLLGTGSIIDSTNLLSSYHYLGIPIPLVVCQGLPSPAYTQISILCRPSFPITIVAVDNLLVNLVDMFGVPSKPDYLCDNSADNYTCHHSKQVVESTLTMPSLNSKVSVTVPNSSISIKRVDYLAFLAARTWIYVELLPNTNGSTRPWESRYLQSFLKK